MLETTKERTMIDVDTHKHTFTPENWGKYYDDDGLTEYEGCDLRCIPCGFRYDVVELRTMVIGSARYWYLLKPSNYNEPMVHSEVIHPSDMHYPQSLKDGRQQGVINEYD